MEPLDHEGHPEYPRKVHYSRRRAGQHAVLVVGIDVGNPTSH
jgi:hypothetical protein